MIFVRNFYFSLPLLLEIVMTNKEIPFQPFYILGNSTPEVSFSKKNKGEMSMKRIEELVLVIFFNGNSMAILGIFFL